MRRPRRTGFFLLHGGTATAVPLRPIVAVYHHVKRGYHPLRGQGRWSSEQDTLLERYVAISHPWSPVDDLSY